MQHPSEALWRKYEDDSVAPVQRRRVARHAEDCPSCMRRLLDLPTPVYRLFGRPIFPVFPLTPPQMEEFAGRIVLTCLDRRLARVPVVVGGAWNAEPVLLNALEIAAGRLRAKEWPVEVHGFIYGSCRVPPPPKSGFGILLGASNYQDLGLWLNATPFLTPVLVRNLSDGPAVDIATPPVPAPLALHASRSLQEAIRNSMQSGEPATAEATLCCGLGCDLPPGFFDGEAPSPFVRIEDPKTGEPTSWRTANGGQWIARTVLREIAQKGPVLRSCLQRLHRLGSEGRVAARRLRIRAVADDLCFD